MYAVSTRHPEKLAAQASLKPTRKGVYEVPWGSRRIHLIVLSEVARVERNAIWQLFSGQRERVRYGASHYHWRQGNLSTVMNRLHQRYRAEGVAMPYTVNDYQRELIEEVLSKLTAEELLKRIPPAERLKGLSPEDINPYLKNHSKSN